MSYIYEYSIRKNLDERILDVYLLDVTEKKLFHNVKTYVALIALSRAALLLPSFID